MALALVLAAPFLLLVLIGIFASIQRGIRQAKEIEQLRKERAEWNRAEGLH